MVKAVTYIVKIFRRPSPTLVTLETTSEKRFNEALDVFHTEFRRLTRENATDLANSLVRLARSPEFQRSANRHFLRQKIYQASIESLGDQFVATLKSILLPHCGTISDQQLLTLKNELRTIITSKLGQAKNGATRFAASLGQSSDIGSIIRPLESIYQLAALRFEELVVSTVKQANLQNERQKEIAPLEIKPVRTRLQK